jgi:hypothetical protein
MWSDSGRDPRILSEIAHCFSNCRPDLLTGNATARKNLAKRRK